MITRLLSKLFLLLWLLQIQSSSCFVGRHSTAVRQNHLPAAKESDDRHDEVIKSDVDDVDDVEVSKQRRTFLTKVSALAGSVVAIGGGMNANNAQAAGLPEMLKFGENSGGIVSNKRLEGLAGKIRGVTRNMDELQRDLMQERWDLVQSYPAQLRSYVPVFTTYTDAAFPTDLPADWGLRVALRYEVGRFFACVERFKRAVERKELDEAYLSYADMSLHLDRYLRVGGLYSYYDTTIDNEAFFEGYADSIVYADPKRDPAEVRDLIVLRKGPDTGKTGIVIGIYPEQDKKKDKLCVVKLDRAHGMREIRVVPLLWAAKRLGEQDPDDVFLIPRNGRRS